MLPLPTTERATKKGIPLNLQISCSLTSMEIVKHESGLVGSFNSVSWEAVVNAAGELLLG